MAANTFLPTGDVSPGEAFFNWQRFSQEVEVFPTGFIVNSGCVTALAPEVQAAYDAPFPDESFKAGARAFPMLVPSSPDDPAHDANVAAWQGLAAFDRPFLTAFGDGDPITRGAHRALQEGIAGAQGPAAHDHRRRRPFPAGRLRRGAGAGRRRLRHANHVAIPNGSVEPLPVELLAVDRRYSRCDCNMVRVERRTARTQSTMAKTASAPISGSTVMNPA